MIIVDEITRSGSLLPVSFLAWSSAATMSDPFANLNLANPQSQQAQQALAQLMQQAQQGRGVQPGQSKQVDPRTVSGRTTVLTIDGCFTRQLSETPAAECTTESRIPAAAAATAAESAANDAWTAGVGAATAGDASNVGSCQLD
jgi:hypothetical protein